MLSSMLSPAFPRPLAGAAVLLVLTAGLSGCGPAGPQFAPVCPTTGILGDAADLTVFRGAGSDLTDMVVDGRITGLSGKCSAPDFTHLRTQISVSMELAAGPAIQGRTGDVTYFVSVSRGDTILDVQRYTVQAAFTRNGGRVRLTGDQVDIVLPTPDKVTGADYRILVGFQLTPEQLAFNRRRGPR